jgi:hypothetical protein
MPGKRNMKSMVNDILDFHLNRMSEQEKARLIEDVVEAIKKRIHDLRAAPHDSRLAPLVELFDDVKPLAHQLLWEQLVSEIYIDIDYKPRMDEVSKKRLEQTRKDNRRNEVKHWRIQGCSEDGGCW